MKLPINIEHVRDKLDIIRQILGGNYKVHERVTLVTQGVANIHIRQEGDDIIIVPLLPSMNLIIDIPVLPNITPVINKIRLNNERILIELDGCPDVEMTIT